jgi:NAD(P)-dependent dehydrogenase (short-subunit alcohol dehydrogenase family)
VQVDSELAPLLAIGVALVNKEGPMNNEISTRRSPAVRMLALGALGFLGWRALRALGPGEDLAGRSVLITGGSRGLGLLLARSFADAGCRVAICARDVHELEAAERELRQHSPEVLTIPCDVSDRAQVADMVEWVTTRFGGIDVLVNNAGIIQMGPLSSMTLEDFEDAMAVNFWGGVYATLEALPRMRSRGDGRIVNITSIGGKVAVPHLLPYDCAKFAMVGFSEGLRAELARDGISVTTVVPGLMRTGSPVNAFFKGEAQKEFTWFSLASATPLTTMSAERAARRIVRATRRREAEITLTWQAKTLRMLHDLLPGTTTDILGLVNRALPSADGPTPNRRGMELSTPLAPSAATAPMNRAAREFNQFAGESRPSPEHARRVGLGHRRDGR